MKNNIKSMKNNIFILVCMVVINTALVAQDNNEWSEPIKIEDISDLAEPNFCIDKQGNMHIAWMHTFVYREYCKVYYKKSTDYGRTWSTSKDISKNTKNYWCGNPHLSPDSQNNLHVSFEVLRGETALYVLYASSDAQGIWSGFDTISYPIPEPFESFLALDENDNILISWLQYNTRKGFYRTKKKNMSQWGDIKTIFNSRVCFSDAVTIGDTIFFNGNTINDNYSKIYVCVPYINNMDYWEEPLIQSNFLQYGTSSIAASAEGELSALNIELSEDTSQVISSCTNLRTLTTDTLIIVPVSYTNHHNDIVYDQYNQPHIIQMERLHGGQGIFTMVHYQKNNGEWIGNTIATNPFPISDFNLEQYGDKLYLVYVKWNEGWGINLKGDLLIREFTPQNLATEDSAPPAISALQIAPNPIANQGYVTYHLQSAAQVDISLYDSQGRLLHPLYSGKQNPGAQQIPFSATGLAKGIYFVRLKANNHLMTTKMIVKNER